MLLASLRQILLAVLFVASPAHAVDWEHIYTQHEVAVSRASLEGTRLVAFKGDTVMEAPLARVLAVILDNEHRTDWVGRLMESRLLTTDDPFDYVVYQSFGLPPPFSDRDYVYRGHAERKATGSVTLHMSSVEHPGAPETIGVRAELVNSRYELTPLPDGRTRVEVEILTDPKGAMPIWIVNLIQRTWPRDTLTGIREQLGKPWVRDHPLPP